MNLPKKKLSNVSESRDTECPPTDSHVPTLLESSTSDNIGRHVKHCDTNSFVSSFVIDSCGMHPLPEEKIVEAIIALSNDPTVGMELSCPCAIIIALAELAAAVILDSFEEKFDPSIPWIEYSIGLLVDRLPGNPWNDGENK